MAGNGEGSKRRMRPAHEIYARLKWDSGLYDTDDILVGYEDRFLGVLTVPFHVFSLPDNEIPFHRVRTFIHAPSQAVLWDRAARVDVITQTDDDSITYDDVNSVADDRAVLLADQHDVGGKLSQSRKRERLKQRRYDKRMSERDRAAAAEREIERFEQMQAVTLTHQMMMIGRAQRRLIEEAEMRAQWAAMGIRTDE